MARPQTSELACTRALFVVRSLVLVATSLFLTVARADDASGVRTSRRGAKQLVGAPEKGVWHFAIFGDRTGGPPHGVEVLREAVRDTNLFDPDLVMTVGDLVEGYNGQDLWLEQTQEFRGIMEQLEMPWYPVAGNHDIYWRGPNRPRGGHEANYEKHFGPLWYWFPHKDTAFVVLYTDEGDPADDSKGFSRPRHTQMSPEQLSWLEKTLGETAQYETVLVFLHHPRWIEQTYRNSNWKAAHSLLAAAGNVKGVFAGHIHRMHYAGKKDGIEYFALATTGGSKRHEIPHAGWTHHFNVVTVRKSGISVVAVPVGTVVDPRKITPVRRKDIDRLLSLDLQPEQPVRLKEDGSTGGSYRLRWANPCSRPLEATFAVVPAEGWRFHPDHYHVSMEAGDSIELEFAYERKPAPLTHFSAPSLRINIDYMAEDARIALPEKEHALAMRLAALPPITFTPGEQALTLDGVSSVAVPHPQFKVPDGPFTVEGWVYPLNLRGRRPLLAKSESSEYCIFVSDAKPAFSVHLAGRYVNAEASQPLLKLRQWQHLAGVYDGQELRLYLNGKKIASAPGSGKRRPNKLPFYIGADPNRQGKPVDSFRGQIDEVRLSRCVRYLEDFTPALRLEPDAETVLLFHFDTTIGPFAPDHSRQHSHGTLIGAAGCSPRLE